MLYIFLKLSKVYGFALFAFFTPLIRFRKHFYSLILTLSISLSGVRLIRLSESHRFNTSHPSRTFILWEIAERDRSEVLACHGEIHGFTSILHMPDHVLAVVSL